MRREVYVQNEDGTRSDMVKERAYDLKSKTQGRMIQVRIPASAPVRDYPYNAVVDLVGRNSALWRTRRSVTTHM